MLLHALPPAGLCGPRPAFTKEATFQHDPCVSIHSHGQAAPRNVTAHDLTPSQLELLLPKDVCKAFEAKLKDNGTTRYAKVYMKLGDIVEGDFFSDYIKTGALDPEVFEQNWPC